MRHRIFSLPLLAALALGVMPVQGHTETTTLPPVTAGSVTLAECYRRALRVSETLAMNEEGIRRLQAQYRESVSTILPHVAWVRTLFIQDTPNTVTQSSSSVQGTLTQANRKESYFKLEQPLFSGFRDFSALSALKLASSQAGHLRQQAANALLADLANVFYTSLTLQQSLAVLMHQRELTEDRLKELQRRVSLGKSRDSEVLSNRVELASINAQIEETRRTLYAARAVLEFLTEVSPEVPLADDPVLPSVPTESEALNRALKRPDFLAAEEQQKIAKARLRYAKGGYYPTLGFLGKYYTEREGFQEDIKWDALFTLDVPIFEGFETNAQVAEARSDAILADLEARRLQRQVRQDVKTARQDLDYALTQAKFYADAVTLGEQNYQAQQKEYRLGLINNLEVLQVLTTLQDLRVRKIQADAAVKLNGVRLRVAMGETF